MDEMNDNNDNNDNTPSRVRSYQRVLEHVRELGLSIGNVLSFRLSEGEHHLLEETQRFVDVLRLLLHHACRLCLYAPFAPSQVYKVELAL